MDFVLLGGGTLIGRSPHYLSSLRAFESRRKIVFGTGVEDPAFWRAMGEDCRVEEWARWIEDADYVSVRGEDSAALLRQWGVRTDVHVVGDPALYFHRASEPASATGQQRHIGLNVGTMRALLWGQDESRVHDAIVSAGRELQNEGWGLRLFCVWRNDYAATMSAARALGIPDRDVVVSYVDVESTLDEMASLAAFVGVKLHSVVLAACAGIPSVMVEYRPKCREFMRSLGQERWVVRSDEVSAGPLASLVRQLLEQRQAVGASVRAACEEMRSRLFRAADAVRDVVRA
jgi:polysaccharide pyruvyl transferase WcaK-like protein